ncbi:MAG: hypothetical protein J6Y94_08430 [Bacteriovoracaceae bacterium]|nr:hypothetical protein [Bacteriovoracaceae bacterium]
MNNETKEVTDISTGTCPADGRFSGNDTDYWGEVNGKDDTYLETQRMMRQCNPTYALKSLNRNFMRSAFDASNDNLKYYQGVEVERDRAQMAQAPLSVAGE